MQMSARVFFLSSLKIVNTCAVAEISSDYQICSSFLDAKLNYTADPTSILGKKGTLLALPVALWPCELKLCGVAVSSPSGPVWGTADSTSEGTQVPEGLS